MIVTDHRALVWIYSLKDPESQIANRLKTLERSQFEIQLTVGQDKPHANCLSRPRIKEGGITTIVDALTDGESKKSKKNQVFPNPWKLLREHDREGVETKQKRAKKFAKILDWLKHQTETQSRN